MFVWKDFREDEKLRRERVTKTKIKEKRKLARATPKKKPGPCASAHGHFG